MPIGSPSFKGQSLIPFLNSNFLLYMYATPTLKTEALCLVANIQLLVKRLLQ